MLARASSRTSADVLSASGWIAGTAAFAAEPKGCQVAFVKQKPNESGEAALVLLVQIQGSLLTVRVNCCTITPV
jgi:hypothetical protein